MVVEVGLPLLFQAGAVNTTYYTQNRYIIIKRHGKTAYELLKERKLDISYILNQRDQRSKFKAKANEGVFLGYSSISKAFMVFNLSRQTVDETTHVTFDEDLFIHDRVDHPSLIFHELTYSPSNHILEFMPNDTKPVVPNVDQIINSQPISEDQPIIPEEAEPSKQEDYAQSNTNKNSNSRILRDHPKSQIIGDVNSKILTHSRVNNNFCMFVNFILMIKPKNVVDTLKEADWIKAMQDKLNNFERHRVWTLVHKPQGKTFIGARWVFRNKMDEDGIVRLVA